VRGSDDAITIRSPVPVVAAVAASVAAGTSVAPVSVTSAASVADASVGAGAAVATAAAVVGATVGAAAGGQQTQQQGRQNDQTRRSLHAVIS